MGQLPHGVAQVEQAVQETETLYQPIPPLELLGIVGLSEQAEPTLETMAIDLE
ncbi:hypothetical protein [Limimaricola cinnabarinus]|uniref:Uncharacterized protein n=1 Tax=Limimaricola cinnabarinus LL-001 TaxID=1337093 RepID=U3AKV8_9RHOB|nr:hypothetical protein [Limimaricola cinnabarinus]GAD55373.1 hypothetical protein MBELCI_1425 [Limimaricola cinnabarinus LL-001]